MSLGDRILTLMAERPRTVMYLALRLREPEHHVRDELIELHRQQRVTADPAPFLPRAQLWRLPGA